jgi:hypothetical protein
LHFGASLCAQHFDAMLRVRTAFVLLASLDLCSAAALDVNQSPPPIVNVIADQPITVSAQAAQLRGVRGTQRSLLEIVDTAQKEFETSAGIELDAQSRQLDNLRRMSARIGGSA